MNNYSVVYAEGDRIRTERVRAWSYRIEHHGVLTFLTSGSCVRSYHNWIKVEEEL